MGDNKVVKSLWLGSALTNLERMCINSFIKNGHEFHLYTYNNILGVPLGAVIKDANEIIDAKEIFCYRDPQHNGSFSAFSNWFRYKMLYELGGYWVDMDMTCLKPFDFEEEHLKQVKKTVLKTHPDKSGLDKEIFLFFCKAYKLIYSVYNFRSSSEKDTCVDRSYTTRERRKKRETGIEISKGC